MAKNSTSDPFQWTVNALSSNYSNISIADTTAADNFQVGETMSITNGNDATVTINAPLIVDNIDVAKTLKEVMSVLGVVSRDIAREEKYKGLKEAAKEYERQLDKYKTFETIKDSK